MISLAIFLLLLSARLCLCVSTIVVSTVTISAQPTATSQSASYTSDALFRLDIIRTHNFYRQEHGVSALVWNDSLAQAGQRWSDECQWKHSGGPTGENLASGFPNVTSAIDAWVDERAVYSWSKPGFSEATGHFTQLVWKETRSVGCGRKLCNTSSVMGWMLSCEYWPPGNVRGEYDENVPRQINGSKSTQQSAAGPAVIVDEDVSKKSVAAFLAALTVLLILS